jgi:hypothetical protein
MLNSKKGDDEHGERISPNFHKVRSLVKEESSKCLVHALYMSEQYKYSFHIGLVPCHVAG